MKARLVAIVIVLTGQADLAGGEPLPCPPSARLAGEPAAVDRIASELAVLGVASQEIPAQCPAVSAEIAMRDDRIELTLRDPAGRIARRTVTDAAVAATVIESWARTDIGAPLLAARLLGVVAVAAPPAVTIASRDRDREVAPDRHRAVYVSAHVERHYVADDSEWRALGVAGCARVDGLCLGGELRVADDHGFSHTGGLTEFQRLDGALLATADLPIVAGRTAIVPGIGVGVGWLQTSRDEPSDPMCNPDGTCNDREDASGGGFPVYVGDGRHRRTFGLRFAVRLATRLPIATRVWLDLGVAAEVSPNAEGEAERAAEPGEDPAVPDGNSGGMLPTPLPADTSLPADPSHQFRFGIGIGYGFE